MGYYILSLSSSVNNLVKEAEEVEIHCTMPHTSKFYEILKNSELISALANVSY